MTAIDTFRAVPQRVRWWVSGIVPLAAVLSVVLSARPQPLFQAADVLAAVGLVAGSVISVEVGRLLEGGRVGAQRPHKGLSAWAMAAAVLLPTFYLVPAIALIYAHARWRGLRVELWKWVASGSFLVAAGSVAGVVARSATGGDAPTLDSGLPGLIATAAAVLTFLLIEAALLAMTAYLNIAQDEVWLRRTLRDRMFYLTESGVLLLGAITGLVAATDPWFVLLLLPAYGFLQQSVLHRPLQDQATRDPKTGLLRFDTWQRNAGQEIRRMNAAGGSWAVVFADIDNFRRYNEVHGHLGGDTAIGLVADLLDAHVRPTDIIARFGGEEFCVLLPDTAAATATGVAERIRRAIEDGTAELAEHVTVSVGVATVDGSAGPAELDAVLALADQALYRAKLDGRNTVRVHSPQAGDAPRPADRRAALPTQRQSRSERPPVPQQR